jgi:hypothetical protein
MAYNNAGLTCLLNSAAVSVWVLKTVDAVGDADAEDYISNAITTASGKGIVGRGMKLGDLVLVMVVDSVAATTSISDTGWYYVSALNTTTGAGTITAVGAT